MSNKAGIAVGIAGCVEEYYLRMDCLLPLDAEERVKDVCVYYFECSRITSKFIVSFLYLCNNHYAICYLISAAYSCHTCPLIRKK